MSRSNFFQENPDSIVATEVFWNCGIVKKFYKTYHLFKIEQLLVVTASFKNFLLDNRDFFLISEISLGWVKFPLNYRDFPKIIKKCNITYVVINVENCKDKFSFSIEVQF